MEQFQPLGQAEVDKCICAEVTDATEDPRLFNVVISHMIRGSGGNVNCDCACKKDGVCSKRPNKTRTDRTLCPGEESQKMADSRSRRCEVDGSSTTSGSSHSVPSWAARLMLSSIPSSVSQKNP